MAATILHFEQPLNERMRTFLRMESLMARIHSQLEGRNAWCTHSAIMTLLEIYSLVTRGDIKRETISEIDRQTASISKYINSPGVNSAQFNKVLTRMRKHADEVHALEGPVGAHLKTNEFLNSIRQRSSIPGGVCDFDLPSYHFWLSRDLAVRQQAIREWLEPFEPLSAAISTLLELVRNSTVGTKIVAQAGFHQQNLDLDIPYQILRVSIPASSEYFPEISAGKHRFSVRFLKQGSPNERPSQIKEDIEFTLTCCSI